MTKNHPTSPDTSFVDKMKTIAKRWHLLSVSLLFLIVFFCMKLCDSMSMEYVPGPTVGSSSLPEFVVKAEQETGIYGNQDVDSLIFTYVTQVKSVEELKEGIAKKIRSYQWKLTKQQGDLLEYRRYFAKGKGGAEHPDMLAFASLEIIRLAFNPRTQKVVVAYVQMDSSDDNESAFEQTDEAEWAWAEEVLWPKFNALLSE